MPIYIKCGLCGRNLESIPTPNGGQMPVETVPGWILEGEGSDYGYEPRNLKRVNGKLVAVGAAPGGLARTVWLPHAPRCPKRDQSVTEKPPEPEKPATLF